MQNHDRSRLPAPPIDEDVDVRSLSWMPIDVSVLQSDLATEGTFAEMGAGWALMFMSWHCVPAGSIPNDDLKLAQMLGIAPKSRDLPEDYEDDQAVRASILARWLKMKEGVLVDWTLHSDGRWYHPMLSKKAVTRYAAYASRKEAAEVTNRKKKGKRIDTLDRNGSVEHDRDGDVIGYHNDDRYSERNAYRNADRYGDRDGNREITEKNKYIYGTVPGHRDDDRERYKGAIEGATFKTRFGMTPTEMVDKAHQAANSAKLTRNSPKLEEATFFATIIDENAGLNFFEHILPAIRETTNRANIQNGSIGSWAFFRNSILARFAQGPSASEEPPSPFVYKLGTKQSQRHWDKQKSCPEDYTNCDDCLDKRHGDNRYWNDKTFGEWRKLIADWERDPATWPKELTFKPDQFGTKVPDHLLMELDKYDYERGRPLFLKTASTSQVQAPTPRSAAPPPVSLATNGVGHPAVMQPTDDLGEIPF